MKRVNVFAVLAGAFTASLIFCSNSVSVGGGTGTETVNTFAMSPDGRPAAGATASIVDARWWFDSISRGASPVLGQAVADANGRIRITYPKQTGSVNLQIDHPDAGVLLTLPPEHAADPDTVRLQPYASIAGSIAPESASSPATSIVLAGSSYRQTVQQAGVFSFEKVAAGSYALLCLAGTAPTFAVAGNTALTLDAGAAAGITLPLHADRLLLDNFESGIGPLSLGRIFPVLGWYVLSDSLYYAWDTAELRWKKEKSVVIGASPIMFDSVSDGKGGKSFNVSTKLDTSSPYANALIGFSLRPLSEEGVNLTAMRGCSFRASGNGTVRIHFETRDLDSASNLQSHYAYQFKLQSSMKDYTIPVDSLRIIEPVIYAAAHPWAREGRHVLRIEFEFPVAANTRGTALQMTLDDLYLEGVSPATFRGEQ